MKRTFKFVSVAAGGTPQPVYGSRTTAAVLASRIPVLIPVADSSWWNKGDYVRLDPLSSNPELLPVIGVPDGTHIQVPVVQFNHLTNVFVQLSTGAYSVFITTKVGNAASVAIGSSGLMNTGTGLYCIYYLPAVAGSTPATYISDPVYGLGNVENPSNYWFDGTTGDSILPSLSVM